MDEGGWKMDDGRGTRDDGRRGKIEDEKLRR
jgi:hypothetical protein